MRGFKRGLIFEPDLICILELLGFVPDLICVVLKGFGNGFDFRAHLICVALEDKVRKWERVWF